MKRFLTVCLAFILLCTGCGLLPEEKGRRKAPVNKTALETQYFTMATVERGDITSGYIAECRYGTQRTQSLAFGVAFEQVTGVYVQKGDPVYEGQLLAEITLGTLEDELEACEDTCKQIDADLNYTTKMLGFETERQKLAKNYGRKYDTKTLDDLTLKKTDLEGKKSVADLKLAETKKKISDRRLVADFDGVVSFVREIRPWEPVGTNTFITITSADNGFIATVEGEEIIAGFREGETYQVETDDDIITCTLFAIRETMYNNRSIIVLVPTDPDLEILPDTEGIVRIVSQEVKNVLYIPTAAVRTIDGRKAVYVVDKDGVRDIRYIEIGLSVSGMKQQELNRTEVRSGLSEGDRVIIR